MKKFKCECNECEEAREFLKSHEEKMIDKKIIQEEEIKLILRSFQFMLLAPLFMVVGNIINSEIIINLSWVFILIGMMIIIKFSM